MPWVVRKTDQCPASKPFGVFNKDTGDLRNRCHATVESAQAQMRALYSAMNRGEIKNSEEALEVVTPIGKPEWVDGNKLWLQVYPFDTWDHPLFGETTIDPTVAGMMKFNYDNRIYGQDLPFGYEHGLDPAKGKKASGWYRGMEVRDDGLYGLIEFTEEAKAEIEDNQWRYVSGEHRDVWEHPQTGETHFYVPVGGTLTNKPWVKGMAPLNFSEFFAEKANEPDSSVASPPSTHTGGTGMAESATVVDEHADLEHSDPGTGNPPAPRTDERNDDDSADSGSRRDTPPIETELDARLREVLGLDKDADIVKAVSEIHAEVKPLRDAAAEHETVKSFSEAFPEQAEMLKKLQAKDRENEAKAFSEAFANIRKEDGTPTGKGYPAVVLDKLAGVHKKFSEGSVTLGDFTEIMELVGRTGLVDYGESGSSRADSTLSYTTDAPKAFSEAVVKIKESETEGNHGKAVEIAAQRHPELFKAYREAVRSRR